MPETHQKPIIRRALSNYPGQNILLKARPTTLTLKSARSLSNPTPQKRLVRSPGKTSVRDGRKESFDFLGYSFGPQRFRKDDHWYLGASPSRKSVARLKLKVRGLRQPGTLARGARPAEQRAARLVALLRLQDAPAGLSSGRQLRL